MLFYKASKCPIALDFFSLFYSKKDKVYIIFLFKINFYFFKIDTECCPIICAMLWRFQLPHIYFSQFKGYFLPILCVLKQKSQILISYFTSCQHFTSLKENELLIPPSLPPTPQKKDMCLSCITTFFHIYCAKSQFLLEFSMIYLPKYKTKILCFHYCLIKCL